MGNKVALVDEKNYEEEMTNVIEPFLKSIRTEGFFNTIDGKKLHYEYHTAENAVGNIVISHGFTESAEKFREMVYYFVKNGYNTFALDHRGHGASYKKPGDGETVRLDSFDDYVRDLNTFITDIVVPHRDELPFYIYSHSMGGAIAALYIEKYPHVFKKAILSAPMICANTGMPIPVAKTLGAVTKILGMSDVSVPGRCKFDPYQTYETSDDMSKVRFNYYHSKRIDNPELRTAGPSFGWAREALRITNVILKDKNCKKVCCPVLVFQPEKDRQVLSPYQNKFVSKLHDGRLIYVRSAKHEIYHSENKVLKEYLDNIFDFLEA